MNPQVLASIRSILLGLGGFVVGKGWIDQSTMLSLVGSAMWLIPAIWSLWGHRQNGIIAAAAAVPDVKAVVTTPEIAHSPKFIDDPKVVQQGAHI